MYVPFRKTNQNSQKGSPEEVREGVEWQDFEEDMFAKKREVQEVFPAVHVH
jgi:hypothetical protein